jgi:hypothetical protein
VTFLKKKGTNKILGWTKGVDASHRPPVPILKGEKSLMSMSLCKSHSRQRSFTFGVRSTVYDGKMNIVSAIVYSRGIPLGTRSRPSASNISTRALDGAYSSK